MRRYMNGVIALSLFIFSLINGCVSYSGLDGFKGDFYNLTYKYSAMSICSFNYFTS